jgi:hypothetical protein
VIRLLGSVECESYFGKHLMTETIPGRPQTMAEYVQRRVRLLMWLQRAAFAALVAAGIAAAFARGDVSMAATSILIFGGVLALKLTQVISDTIRCPPCGNKLDPRTLRGSEPIRSSCPKCGADFNQPMPQGRPINPIS